MGFEHLMNELPPKEFPYPYDEIAELIGSELTVKFMKQYGGVKTYFPTEESVIRVVRNRQIVKEYNGTNKRKLAIKYGVTENWIGTILRESGCLQ